MRLTIILSITFSILMLNTDLLFAQKDGIKGYGSLNFSTLNTYGNPAYFDGGGGVIINNNIVVGVFVSAPASPYRWDLFSTISSSNPDEGEGALSKNEEATNTTISNVDVGANLAFNVSPAKSFQFTIGTKIGYSTINYIETYFDENADPNLEDISIKNLNIVKNNISFSPQLDLQFKIGGAFKLSVLGGYKYQPTKIRDLNAFPDIDNLLVDKHLFGGAYIGIGFIFGNL